MNKSFYLLFALYPIFHAHGETGTMPLTLNSAIEMGLKNNPELTSSAAKIRASNGRFWSAISPPPAEVSTTNDYVPTGQSLNRFGEKTVGVNQSIEFPTNYFVRGSKFKKEAEISRQEYSQAGLTVTAKIKSSYFKALALQEQITIAHENVEIADHFVKKAEIRYSVGEATNLEKLTAKAQYTQALNELDVNKNHLIAAYADLNYALGFGKHEKKEFELVDSLKIPPCNVPLDTLINDAACNNPQIKINKLREEAYAAEKKLAWSGFLPGITIGVFSKKVRGDTQDYYGASAGITIPLWFMLDQHGKIKEASANLISAQSDSRSMENSVYLAAQHAYTEFMNAEKQVVLYQKELLPQTEEIYRAASKSYEAGEITYIEFLQAQQTLINSRGGYIDALLSYNLSIVAIEESIGKTLR
ncbi:MAG TPA: TolC family protein [Chitinivibrionales bacterium]